MGSAEEVASLRVGIIQPNYIPWRGYFDFIASVDLFLFLDDVQYTTRDWRNRNCIKAAKGLRWLTVPVRRGSRERPIHAVEIADDDWRSEHLDQIHAHYEQASHLNPTKTHLLYYRAGEYPLLADMTIFQTLMLMEELSIKTPTMRTSSLRVDGKKTERLINLCRAVGATTYLSGPAAKGYLDVEQFRTAGIGLEYKRYDYEPYPQLHGPFIPAVSVLDLLFNTGPHARDLCRSKTPNEVVLVSRS